MRGGIVTSKSLVRSACLPGPHHVLNIPQTLQRAPPAREKQFKTLESVGHTPNPTPTPTEAWDAVGLGTRYRTGSL